MRTKDCFFGQVRAVTETWKGRQTTWAPPALGEVTRWAVTWDDVTGLNPLYDKCPVECEYHRYGEMLAGISWDNYSFVNDFIKPHQTPEYYEQQIKEDYNSQEARLCFLLAIAYGIDTIVSKTDCQDYDFVVARQFDTWWSARNPDVDETAEFMLNKYPQRLSEYTSNIHDIPLAYISSINAKDHPVEYTENFPIIGSSKCIAQIFNAQAVKLVANRFFDMTLREYETIYRTLGTDMQSRIMSWQPGYIVHRVLTKCDVHIMDIQDLEVLNIRPGWNVDCPHDFSHIARSTGDSD